jgi:D-alanyl-D-alanine carboxypeptidase (penicillin-binding protein 5/6)
VDGLQTGFTEAAGYCMVATARRSFPNLAVAGAAAGRTGGRWHGRRLLSIVLGAASENARANESQKLLNWGFTAFEAVKLFDPNQPVATPAVWKGTEPVSSSGARRCWSWRCPPAARPSIKTTIVRPEPLVAPFAKGQAIGTLKVTVW